jgi:hypothetical protein
VTSPTRQPGQPVRLVELDPLTGQQLPGGRQYTGRVTWATDECTAAEFDSDDPGYTWGPLYACDGGLFSTGGITRATVRWRLLPADNAEAAATAGNGAAP